MNNHCARFCKPESEEGHNAYSGSVSEILLPGLSDAWCRKSILLCQCQVARPLSSPQDAVTLLLAKPTTVPLRTFDAEIDESAQLLASNEIQRVANKEIKPQQDFRSPGMSGEVFGCKKRRLDHRDGENSAAKPSVDFTTKWEELQQAHHFPGNLSTIFQHFAPKVGSPESNRLLQLALGLLFPETLLKIRDYLICLRQNGTLQPEADNPIPCWIYQTAIQSCQGHEPQTYNRRLLQWYVYSYIQSNVGLWDHATKKARTVNHVIEQICQSGAQGVLLKDIKRRVYSWYDQGREWNDIVRAAGSGDILLFLPSKPIRHSLAPTASATKYRDLDSSQAQVVMNMLQEVLPSANFLGNELLFETFLFHRPPDKLFRIEELSDNDIRNVSIYSKQAFGLLTESRGTN